MVSGAYPDVLENYLQAVAGDLTSMSSEDRLEVVRELRSHVLDVVDGDLSEDTLTRALAALGPPKGVAQINLRMRIARAVVSDRTPWSTSRNLVRLACIGGEGLWVFVVSSVGYAVSACWLLTALAKPFFPDRVGLWVVPDSAGDLSLSLGRHGSGVVGSDIFGWWIMPMAILLAIACGVAVYRYDLRFVRRVADASLLPPRSSIRR